MVWMYSVYHMIKGSDTWSLAGGSLLEGCGTLRRWGFAGGSELVGASLGVLYFGHTPCMLTASWLLMQCDQQPPYTLAAYRVFDHNNEKKSAGGNINPILLQCES